MCLRRSQWKESNGSINATKSGRYKERREERHAWGKEPRTLIEQHHALQKELRKVLDSVAKAKEPFCAKRTSHAEVDRWSYLRKAAMLLQDRVGELAIALRGSSGMARMPPSVAKLGREEGEGQGAEG